MRAVEQAVLEAVLGGRLGVVERAFLQPADRVDQHRGGQLAAGQHVVADREFLVDLALDEALVDAFVAAAEQDQARQSPPVRRDLGAASAARPAG